MNRAPCLTQKVKTPFGNMYAHIAYLGNEAVSVHVSVSGNRDGSTIDNAIRALSGALRQLLNDVRATPLPQKIKRAPRRLKRFYPQRGFK